MTRKMLITLEVTLDHLPIEDIDDLDSVAEETGKTLEQAADALLAEAADWDVADCIVQSTYDEEMFAGSMLYLRVNETKVVNAKWSDAA